MLTCCLRMTFDVIPHYVMLSFVFFFFFSSRRRHTRWPRDWSSDVCSSDLFEAYAMIVRGFVEPISRELTMEYAIEQIGRASCRERVESWEGVGCLRSRTAWRARRVEAQRKEWVGRVACGRRGGDEHESRGQ